MILRGQIDPKHQCKKFCRFDTLQEGVKICWGGGESQISHVSKNMALRITIFSPMDSVIPVFYLSVIHCVALAPLFLELFSRTMHFAAFVTF